MTTRPVPWRSQRVARLVGETPRLTGEALLLRALEDLCVSDDRGSKFGSRHDKYSIAPSGMTRSLCPPSPASSTKTLVPFYNSPGYFFKDQQEVTVLPLKRLSSRASCAGSESSQVIADFFDDAGSYSSSIQSEYDSTEAKLVLWQAILVAVGYCEGLNGEIVTDVKKPPHFPDPPMPVPDSLTACRKIIQGNVFLNCINFKRSQQKKEPLLLFDNKEEMWMYTKKYARFIKLTKAKQDLLNPLLRYFDGKNRLETVGEEVEEVKVERKKGRKRAPREMPVMILTRTSDKKEEKKDEKKEDEMLNEKKDNKEDKDRIFIDDGGHLPEKA